jgi:hypothetical protein
MKFELLISILESTLSIKIPGDEKELNTNKLLFDKFI